ncbi:MAG TPA: hypothetical protein PLT76_02210 [Candidatus Omnitrophota bacterium]|nr:ATP-binding protein [Candidatus Omnitrophota bacterium]HPB67740.1 hypothetical protein [Candidatus Omnitrophota bacterium]HQO57520.1 hypothetical protein [Candidatus Omnitrophota bacterium]HQP11227.1 hypothetical protein [Candidatus Omnitrophota bacterium]
MSRIDLDAFFDRRDMLDLLKRRVLDLKEGYRQNIAFLGGRHLGKSSILEKFIAELDDPFIIPLYLDLEYKDFDFFYFKFVGGLLYHYARLTQKPLHDDINLLLEGVRSELPLTAKSIKKIQGLMAHQRLQEAYSEIIALPQVFTQESRFFCLIIFDEFHDLEELGMEGVYAELGKCIMTQKKCLYVVTSSCPVLAAKIISERLSLLFGNFEVVPIEPFSMKASRDFIGFLLKDIKLSKDLKNFFVDFTGGHPLYLTVISKELITLSRLYGQPEIFNPLMIQAVENVLFDPWGVLSQHFEVTVHALCEGKGNRICAAILIALAAEKQRIKELAAGLGVRQGLVSPKLNRLVEQGFVMKNGTSYYIKDKFFGAWLKFVLQKKLRTFDPAQEHQRQAFKDEMERVIGEFNHCSQKDLPTRIVELLYCFEDDAVQINNRRYKLPLFQAISTTKARKGSGTYYDVIKAQTQDGEWCIVLNWDPLTEQDISSILKESKKIIQKPQKRILISLCSLDENTRVKALQESMWIWNEHEVNTLLNFYNKPYIVPAGAP